MTTTQQRPELDQDALGAFVGRVIGDLGATVSAALVVIGDRLGLYRAMADGAPVTPEQLAERTGTAVAYLRPWLANQAAGGYLQYDPASGTWSMTAEQAYALAVEDGTAFLPGSMQLALSALRDVPEIEQCFRTGAGFGWHEHETSEATDLPTGRYDLITMFDCLHDMGDPEAAARAARRGLADDGTLLVVEPMAGDQIEDNLHTLGRVFYGASALICTPCSLAQPGSRALGPQAGPARIISLLRDAGFGAVRVATTTPVNLVIEARP